MVTKLADDKIYTSIVEVPEGEEEEKKDDVFPEEEDDKRSYQSEEAIKPEVVPKAFTSE